MLHNVDENLRTHHQGYVVQKFTRERHLKISSSHDSLCGDEHQTHAEMHSLDDVESTDAKQLLWILLLEHVTFHLREIIRDEHEQHSVRVTVDRHRKRHGMREKDERVRHRRARGQNHIHGEPDTRLHLINF